MKKLFYIAFALGVASCSTADQEDLVSSAQSTPETYSSHIITQDEAVNLAVSFRNGSETLSRSGDADESDVENVVTVRWEDLYPGVPNPVIGDDAPASRALGVGKVTVDTLFYIVNSKNNAGYTLVSAIDKTDPIYIMTEHGTFNPGNLGGNQGFVEVVDRSVEVLLNYLEINVVHKVDDIFKPEIYEPAPGVYMTPGVYAKWGPKTPYNDSWETQFDETIVAIAQMMTYYTPEIIFADGQVINESVWENINIDCINNNGFIKSENNCRIVASLMQYLTDGLNYNTNNGCESFNITGDAFRDITKLSACGDFSTYKPSEVLEALDKNNIVLVLGEKGENGNKVRTTFIIDGAKCVSYEYEGSHYSRSQFVHCNWGKDGSGNGYYLKKILDTDVYMPDGDYNPRRYICNFDKLKYVVITK